MFFRTKSSGPRTYLQVVENRWEGGRSRQRVVATLGRLDQLRDSGQLDALLISGARLAHSVMILSAHAQGRLPVIRTQRIGPALIFERLWQQTGCQRVIQQILADRRFEFDVERAIFLTVLHRLFVSGSDRAADKWRRYYRIEGCDSLQLHHLYRAMAWLGQELPKDQQKDATPFAPRCTKDRIEEALFEHRRDLFSELQLVFFDTTSIYFEGQGGESLGLGGFRVALDMAFGALSKYDFCFVGMGFPEVGSLGMEANGVGSKRILESADQAKSPRRILVRSLLKSRNKLREKYRELRAECKRWRNQAAAVERSRSTWRERTLAHEASAQEDRAARAKLESQLQQLREQSERREVESAELRARLAALEGAEKKQ